MDTTPPDLSELFAPPSLPSLPLPYPFVFDENALPVPEPALLPPFQSPTLSYNILSQTVELGKINSIFQMTIAETFLDHKFSVTVNAPYKSVIPVYNGYNHACKKCNHIVTNPEYQENKPICNFCRHALPTFRGKYSKSKNKNVRKGPRFTPYPTCWARYTVSMKSTPPSPDYQIVQPTHVQNIPKVIIGHSDVEFNDQDRTTAAYICVHFGLDEAARLPQYLSLKLTGFHVASKSQLTISIKMLT